MTSRSLNTLAAASLLAALAVALLWVRSYLVHDTLLAFTARRGVGVHSTGGRFLVLDESGALAQHGPGVSWRREEDVVPYGAAVRLALVHFEAGRFGNGRLFVFPQWPLVAALAVPAALVTHSRRRREHRIAGGACPHCNYDLTGNVSGVCPECGHRAVKGGVTWGDEPERSQRERRPL
jgi:hypothetical protein